MGKLNPTVEKYLEENKVSGASWATIRNKRSILYMLNTKKRIDKWSRDDVTRYINALATEYKESSVEAFKRELKAFYNWMGKPENVAHVQSRIVRNALKRDEVLTLSDVYAMMDVTESPLYKALLIFLYESGGRANEVLNVKVRDIETTDKGMMVTLHQTKWGNRERKDVYLHSAQYIRNLIAYLNLDKDDYLFKSSHKKTGNTHILNQHANKIVQDLAIKAEIKKPVSLHKFRHALATEMTLRGYPESIICQKFGWVLNSDAAMQYKHLDDNDVIAAKLRMSGLSETSEMPPVVIRDVPKIEVIDAIGDLKKQMVDIEELKKQNEMFKQQFTAMQNAFGLKQKDDGSFEFLAEVRQLPDNHPLQRKKGVVGVVTSDKLSEDHEP